MKKRLDEAMVERGLVHSRSHAQRLIKLHKVIVGSRKVDKPSQLVYPQNSIVVVGNEDYVSRAGYKLASVVGKLKINFNDSVILDVGSSTGGFTDYALQHSAKKVIAVDVGTNQLHPKLRTDGRVELHEQTDIRDFLTKEAVDFILIDVSFISLRQILPSLVKFLSKNTKVIAMCKPQFEAGQGETNKGVVKNSALRRRILTDFELWLRESGWLVEIKADSDVHGEKGNLERFYLIRRSI